MLDNRKEMRKIQPAESVYCSQALQGVFSFCLILQRYYNNVSPPQRGGVVPGRSETLSMRKTKIDKSTPSTVDFLMQMG